MPEWRKNRSPVYFNFQPFRPFNNGKNEGMQVPCLLTFTGRSEYLDILKELLWIIPFLYLSNIFCNKKSFDEKTDLKQWNLLLGDWKGRQICRIDEKNGLKWRKKNGLKHGKDRKTAGTLKKRRLCRSDEKTGDEKTGFYCMFLFYTFLYKNGEIQQC